VGDRVRVRTRGEILATLDQAGRLDALPFQPEMMSYCGREFTVLKRIDKVLDTVDRTGLRRMHDAVILDGVRCTGAEHGGCQALCQHIWKEAWLERAPAKASTAGAVPPPAPVCTEARLTELTRRTAPDGSERFSCQLTEIKNASSPLAWWDPRQDLRDLRSGNVTVGEMARYFCAWLFRLVSRRVRGGTRVLVPLYNAVQRVSGGEPILPRQGTLERTPHEELHLQPGELVTVKSHGEIVDTLDKRNKNRGLWFDLDMVKHCGKTYRVLSRVERIIDHKSGRMIELPNECIILDGVAASGNHRRFFPQNEYPFWREIWLRRVPQAGRATVGEEEPAHALG
jgi:hypothetical protein